MNIQFVRNSASNADYKDSFESANKENIFERIKCFDEVPLNVSICKEQLSVLIYLLAKV
jgi:hypothetical protein